jgi:endonuclease/exonuclease/phosphatase family metal-dependent hydrolase
VSLSVLTLNIWHDAGPWSARAERIRAWLDRLDPDLIGLQEVLHGPGRDQLAELLDGRGYHVEFARACPYWAEPSIGFGNAIASRWPISACERLQLPDRGDGEARSALTVQVEAPFGPLSVTCTHLNWKFHHGDIREQQVMAVVDQVLQLRPRYGFPPILMGDFNAEPEADEIRYLKGLHSLAGRRVFFHDAWSVAGGTGPGHTWSNRNDYARKNLEPDRRIDYIFVGYPRPDGVGRLESCQVVCDEPLNGVWPTDHFGVFARLSTDPVAV